jgi:hypothetical protein
MPDQPESMQESDKPKELAPSAPKNIDPGALTKQPDFFLPPALQSLLALEQQRIESTNRRTDVARYAIETSDLSDKRQFEYQMAKLNADSDHRARNYTLAKTVILGTSVGAVCVGGLLLWMAFFGTPSQSAIAIDILKYLGAGVGGYGAIHGVVRGFSRLLRGTDS